MFLQHSYDWWEHSILLVIYLIVLIFLVYTRRYFWTLLKSIPVFLYLCVATLALLQYMGENAIIFSESFGLAAEELAETVVYSLALGYLWRFKVLLVKPKTTQAVEPKITASTQIS